MTDTYTTRNFYGAARHACQRLQERYGLSMSMMDYAYLCGQLAQLDEIDGLPFTGAKQKTLPRPLLTVKVMGVRTRCVYDRRNRLIVTFLPAYKTGGGTEERGERAWVTRQAKRSRRYTHHPKYRQEWR